MYICRNDCCHPPATQSIAIPGLAQAADSSFGDYIIHKTLQIATGLCRALSEPLAPKANIELQASHVKHIMTLYVYVSCISSLYGPFVHHKSKPCNHHHQKPVQTVHR